MVLGTAMNWQNQFRIFDIETYIAWYEIETRFPNKNYENSSYIKSGSKWMESKIYGPAQPVVSDLTIFALQYSDWLHLI